MAEQAAVILRLAGARVRSDWQYRTSFFLTMVAQAASTSLEMVAVFFVTGLSPSLGGWTQAQVLFSASLVGIAFALSDLIGTGVEHAGDYIRAGEFDRILLRPVSAIAQLAALDFQIRRVGKLAMPLTVFILTVGRIGVDWSATTVAYLAMVMISGCFTFLALWILSGALAFFTLGGGQLAHSITYGSHASGVYPVHLYPRWVRTILGWAVPVAFIGYLPTLHLAGAPNPLGIPHWLVYCPPLAALGSIAVALACWQAGVRRYQGTGS